MKNLFVGILVMELSRRKTGGAVRLFIRLKKGESV